MRKLVSLRKIDSIEPINGADNIEKAIIDGWSVVVKKNVFTEGDLCVYFEIDSLLPDWKQFEFLKGSSWNQKLKKYKLRTAKIRGVISQGLALPLHDFSDLNIDWTKYSEGDDLTELFQVEKYEPPIPATLSGSVNNFTWPIPKTDEERIQNMPDVLQKINKKPYYITIKLDGTSSSFILIKKEDNTLEFHACSRNYSIKKQEGNTIWKIAEKYNIEEKLRDWYEKNGELLAIQGEIVGPSIQKNKLNLPDHELYIFNIYNVETQEKFSFEKMYSMFINIPKVPILEEGESFSYSNLEEILKLAEGKYKEHIPTALPNQEREGIVIRTKDQTISFKVISNKFLLNGGE